MTKPDEHAPRTSWIAADKAIHQIAAALEGDVTRAAERVLELARNNRLKVLARYQDEVRINADGEEYRCSKVNKEVPSYLWTVAMQRFYLFEWKINSFRGNGDYTNSSGELFSIWVVFVGIQFLKNDLKTLLPRLKEKKGADKPAIPLGILRTWLEGIPDRMIPTRDDIIKKAKSSYPQYSISRDRVTKALHELDGPRPRGGKKRSLDGDFQAKGPSK
jgi:hypothetical protein